MLSKLIKNSYIQYTALFLLVFFAGFTAFWLEGRTLIWRNDGLATWYPAFRYSGQFFRHVISNALRGDFNASFIDFRLGLGDDPVMTLHYGRVDLLNIVAVFVPARYAQTAFSFFVGLLYYLSGLAFLYFANYRKADRAPALVATMAYVFCGWMLSWGSRHATMFLHATIYLPLMVCALERTLRGGKPTFLIVTTALLALTGFYFVYIVLLFFVPYTLLYTYYVSDKDFVKRLLQRGGYAVLACVIGLAISAFQLVPSILFQLQSDRQANVMTILDLLVLRPVILYPIRLTAITSFADPLAFSALILFAALWLVFGINHKRERLMLGVLFVLTASVMFMPLTGWVLNGFAFPSLRPLFLFTFVASVIVMKAFPELIQMGTKLRRATLIVIPLYMLAVLGSLMLSASLFNLLSLVYIGILFIVISFLGKPYALKRWTLSVISVLGVAVGVQIYFLEFFGRQPDSFIFATESIEAMRTTPEPLRPLDNAFHRIDNITIGNTLSDILPSQSVLDDSFTLSSYSSIRNRYFSAFEAYLEVSSYFISFVTRDFDQRAALNALLSVRYAITFEPEGNRLLPYAHLLQVLPISYGDTLVFLNPYALPFGFTYTQTVSERFFRELNPVERQELMLHYLVLEDSANHVATSERLATAIPFEISETYQATWDAGILRVTDRDSYIRISFQGTPNSETYLRLQGLGDDSRGLATLRASHGDFEKIRTVGFPQSNYYSSRHARYQTINLGFSQEPLTYVYLSIQEPGTYTLESIEIITLPLDGFANQIATLSAEYLTHLDFHTTQPGLTNRFSGRITTSGDRYLFISIPYSSGWRASVNGVATPILRANIGFMAIELPAGEHEIVFSYRTPGLTAGLLVSGVGLLSACGVHVAHGLEDKKRKQGERNEHPTKHNG